MEAIFIDRNIPGFKVAIVLFVNVPSLHSLLPHGLLHWSIGTLLKTKQNRAEQLHSLLMHFLHSNSQLSVADRCPMNTLQVRLNCRRQGHSLSYSTSLCFQSSDCQRGHSSLCEELAHTHIAVGDLIFTNDLLNFYICMKRIWSG